MRLWGLLLTPLLASSTLVGCTSTSVPLSSRSVGDCWEISAGTAHEEFLNSGSPAIKCGQDAQAVTYFVGEIAGASEDGYLSDQFLSAESTSALPESMNQEIINSCQESLNDLVSFGSLKQLRESRIVWDFTLPSRDEWKSGDRWFSCETSILELGSNLMDPVWAPLTLGLDTVTKLASDKNSLSLCFDTAVNSLLPTSTAGVVSSCTDARWHLAHLPLDNGYGEFYPGVPEASAIAEESCRARYTNAKRTFTAPLLEADWNAPSPTIACWYSLKDDPTTPEELAAAEARIAADQQAQAETAARQAAANKAWQQYLDDQANQNAQQAEAERIAAEEAARIAAEQAEAERIRLLCLEDPSNIECPQP